MDDEVNGRYSNDRQLELLSIDECQMKTMKSFVNLCDWGMSYEWFEFIVKFYNSQVSKDLVLNDSIKVKL